MAKKTWKEKFVTNHEPHIELIDKQFADIPAGATMFIATPTLVADYLHQTPAGANIDTKKIRQDLAAANHAEYTCPVTTGIFLRIVAEAAMEDHANGVAKNKLTPFWRAIPPKAPIRKKLSFPVEIVDQWRAEEGLPV